MGHSGVSIVNEREFTCGDSGIGVFSTFTTIFCESKIAVENKVYLRIVKITKFGVCIENTLHGIQGRDSSQCHFGEVNGSDYHFDDL